MEKITSEELYAYIHNAISKIRDKYKNADVCEFGVDRICANKNHNRRPNEGCCRDCIYHSAEIGCKIPNVNLTCMAAYCEYVTLIPEKDKLKLKSIETLLKMMGVQPRITYDEQIMILDDFNNRLNTSRNPLKDAYNIFKKLGF